MFSSITSFISNFISSSRIIPLYLDESQNEYISIELTPEITINDINSKNIQIIKKIIDQINIKNYSNCLKLRKENDYIIINEQNIFTRIKLNYHECPWNYLKNYYDNIYYLQRNNFNYKNNIRKNFFKNINIIDKDNLVNNNELIFIGEVEIFSFINFQFESKMLKLFSDKILSKNDNSNSWLNIPLTHIKFLYSEKKDIQNFLENFIFNDNEYDNIFMIITKNMQKIIYKVINKNEKVKLVGILKLIIEQIKLNSYFDYYEIALKKVKKNLYSSIANLIFNLFTIKGIIIFEESNQIFFHYIKGDFLKNFIDFYKKFKLSLIKNAIKESLLLNNFIEFLELNKTYNYNKQRNIKINPVNEKVDKNFLVENYFDKNNVDKLKFYDKNMKDCEIILDELYNNISKNILDCGYQYIKIKDTCFNQNIAKSIAIKFCHINKFCYKDVICFE